MTPTDSIHTRRGFLGGVALGVVALSAPGRWSYVYGRLSDANAQDVVAGAAAYAAAPDGIVPWRTRPEIFRKQSLARIPPIISLPEAAE